MFWVAQIVFLYNFAAITVGFKNAFSGLVFRKQKGTRVFQWQENINFVVITALSSTKLRLSFNLEPRFLGKRTSCPWSQPHFLRKFDESLLSPKQNKLKEIRTRLCRRKNVEDNNIKKDVSPNIPCTFLLFSARVFYQICIPRKTSFKFCTTR